MIWWYRCYRPGEAVNRVGGANGIILLSTAAFGIAGVVLSLTRVPIIRSPKIESVWILTAGIAGYAILLLLTRFAFNRIVTTELILIVGWAMLETAVICNLNAGGGLTGRGFTFMCTVIAIAFIISVILYVAYYRMEEMRAFYAAMVPLILAGLSMGILIVLHAAKI
ncbi:MAG: hypothetical protein IKS99_01665, partial [Firmicutes bacterium]|nr:hypothetical protein [Bacillota bacterium]